MNPESTQRTSAPCLRKNSPASLHERGFALIVTLSLMILLTVIAVGLLTLSSISLRSSSQGIAMATARANARLAMTLALGDLQRQTGSDTRVTARADILDPNNPPVLGVWKSWEGTDHDATGKPVVPDYASKQRTGNSTDAPATTGVGRFLGWLTSTATVAGAADVKTIPDVSNKSTSGTIRMVSTGSVEDAALQVHMKPTMIGQNQGSMAWWVSGNNSKAMINTDRTAKPKTTVGWQQRARANGKADAKSFGLENVDTFAVGTVIPSTGSLKLVNPAADLKKIHDLTDYSRGLLTNTATGGWRRDLSLLVEKWASLPSKGLPLFTLAPGKDQTYSKADQPYDNPLLYPWTRYRNNATGQPCYQVPPICSWSALIDYARQYENLTSSSASKTVMPSFSPSYWTSNRIDYQDKVRRVPQIARIQWIYSLGSRKIAGTNPVKYNPGILITPVLTLWNPYNIELTISSLRVEIVETAPLKFKLNLAGAALGEVSTSDISKATGSASSRRFFIIINGPITLAPGCTQIFSTADKTPLVNTSAKNIILKPGYTPGGGVLFTYVKKTGTTVAEASADGNASFEMEKITYDVLTTKNIKYGLGISYDVLFNGADHSNRAGAYRMLYNPTELGGSSVVDKLYPPLLSKVSAPLSSIEVTAPTAGSIPSRPFASALFGYRMASPLSRDVSQRHLFSKGMLQANPLCYYAETGLSDDENAVTELAGTGAYHPIHAPCDFAFEDLEGWNDTQRAPQWHQPSGSSYIVSGLTSSDGLTRCVMAELPTRPLQSLAELQHFDARNNNPLPPFQFNLISNGSAHPLFAPDQVMVEISNKNYKDYGMCNDDTYILNHLFFDDWFVSSISPDLQDFSKSIKTNRNTKDVYKEHLELKSPLPNRFYLPTADANTADGKADAEKAADAVMANTKDGATDKYPFETIASKLEVEGMFNINSTSLEAWKAILRQNRDMEAPWLDASGSTNPGKAASFSYSRTSIAGDQGSDSRSKASGPDFEGAAEFAGHRVLTDKQIDALAAEIVSEIRKRGPFLSLAEFVNRQLTSDKSLAIASTIQKALDNLAARGTSAENPFAAIQAVATEITGAPPGTTDYKFPEAALGSSAFGVPGWIRQADILKPLAPILSARDDTFTIRAYGDSRDKADKTKIIARAWCEVVVRRQAAYIDPIDPAGVAPYSTQMKSDANKRFGRRYEIVSFRWLDEKEI